VTDGAYTTLAQQFEAVSSNLRRQIQVPDNTDCAACGPLVASVNELREAVGLLCSHAANQIRSRQCAGNSIQVGNTRITGTVAIIAVAVVYLIAKTHGLTP